MTKHDHIIYFIGGPIDREKRVVEGSRPEKDTILVPASVPDDLSGVQSGDLLHVVHHIYIIRNKVGYERNTAIFIATHDSIR